MESAARRKELATFVRSRRERVSPATVGLPQGPQRRTPGLRREEVAQLSGVSVTWYTWLEQGRPITMSRQVVRSIGQALRMDPDELRLLFTLADIPIPAEPVSTSTPLLQKLVDGLTPYPAYALSPCWDLLCWNRAEAGLIGDPLRLPAAKRNILWLVFTSPAMHSLLPDWQREAQQLLAQYRAAAAQYAGDARFEQLTEALHAASPLFRAWWQQHDIAAFQPARKHFNHPVLGALSVDYMKLAPMEQQSHARVVVYLPADDATSAKLPRLADNVAGVAETGMAGSATPGWSTPGATVPFEHIVSGTPAMKTSPS
ncbi:helix-turn-helix transcriptional regulator [Streptomyces sp. NPDC020883]|uniref:helix-turn-helix transcriptional regulator n=1 Tax=Streptomyces sp. NPDC020883 TaxID=3365099 RepID=UPI0037A59352